MCFLTKGDDIKYLANTIEVAFYNPSTSKLVNYTTKLQNANEVNAGESGFHELTDGFYDWANLTYESNQAKKQMGKRVWRLKKCMQ